MPAILDDPTSPTIYRVSGAPPYPDPDHPALPADIVPRQVTLRDRQTVATIVPFASYDDVPQSLLQYLCDQLNKEIDGGDTYPMMDSFLTKDFARYWFQTFGAVMLLGSIGSTAEVIDAADSDWSQRCLGSFYIKPNYPGRSSHICNGGFIVTDASRNRGVGRLMGEAYIDWAPRLGYSYSVFNLVYETNVASCRIWDALGFKRIGRVKGCGNLRSYPDRLIDAIIYGRDLVLGGGPGDGEDLVSEERFDKIKFYLKYGKYPNGADRAEKSRLRSAATHYKLLEGDKLMLKDKEVIADPARQYEIARAVHVSQHGGINKTTATIAEKYHWSRIKETVSDVIRNCVECKELGKTPNPGGASRKGGATTSTVTSTVVGASSSSSSSPNVDGLRGVRGTTPLQDGSIPGDAVADDGTGGVLALQAHPLIPVFTEPSSSPSPGAYANPSDISVIPPTHTLQTTTQPDHHHHHGLHPHTPAYHDHHHSPMLQDHPHHLHGHHHHHPDDDDAGGVAVYQPIDPQIINHHHHHHTHDNPFDHYHAHADFQALLSATDLVPGPPPDHVSDADAVDRDLDMLIEHQDDDDDDDDEDGGADADATMVDGVRGVVDDLHGDGRDAGGQRGRDLYGVTFGGQGS
jgi:GNAT superfamily N-acetyltransferase